MGGRQFFGYAVACISHYTLSHLSITKSVTSFVFIIANSSFHSSISWDFQFPAILKDESERNVFDGGIWKEFNFLR